MAAKVNRWQFLLMAGSLHHIFLETDGDLIGMADVLYGLTMEEQGISKIVSVKFHTAEEVVTDHTPASLERPFAMAAALDTQSELSHINAEFSATEPDGLRKPCCPSNAELLPVAKN